METAPEQLASDVADALDLIKDQLIGTELPLIKANRIIALINLAKEAALNLSEILDPCNPQSVVKPLYPDNDSPTGPSPIDISRAGPNVVPLRRR